MRIIKRTAEISDCGRYRWWLRRDWGGDGQIVCFVMLNPSTADDSIDDPTIRRCIGFAKQWGFDGVSVRNLFPLRSTNPKALLTDPDPVGGIRGDNELAAARSAQLIVAAWGAFVPFHRDEEAFALICRTNMFCLGLTKHGMPRHPLYVKADQELIPFTNQKVTNA